MGARISAAFDSSDQRRARLVRSDIHRIKQLAHTDINVAATKNMALIRNHYGSPQPQEDHYLMQK